MWSVEPAAVLASAGAEAAISAETAAAAAAAAPALTATTPMGGDPDSIAFSAALNACGVGYLGVVAEHVGQRSAFAGAQTMAAGVSEATEVLRAATVALGG
ncbi:PE domain-containing protein [Mycolicibacterium novocastrense]|uniref:PE domain-containing protein n=1 Tax=Mycolicibacterium novocastrense TaxID=59813 RepID=A0AAW5SQR8_MYCNV|nr:MULTISPECIES: PE domain-containing protein [Mycolicibacterium]MCV7026624.1 PE domain-containing protein [Mycolicibacterium novocastrense]MDX1887496.1 PE domain-containing protein [Mycolicibacterium sp. 120270]GAT07623.1 PE family protein [Mycolicibacterium novocastrense]